MNRELKQISIVVLAMFVALFVAVSLIQVVQADSLNADPRNARTRYDGYDVQRGAILVAGKPIAQSVPESNDVYQFQRTYSNGPLYSAVTGFYPVNGQPTGIEGALNDQLSGTSNATFLERINNLITGKSPQGNSVELTLDPDAQKAAYEALGKQQGAVVLLQVKTGRIKALVSTPSFDPNVLAGHDTTKVDEVYDKLLKAPGSPLVNKAITDTNPPGSTFKPIVSSAAFSSGDYTPKSTLPNLSSLKLPGTGTIVKNDNFSTCGGSGKKVTIHDAQVYSCNIPFAELGMKLGSDTLRDQAEKFGFNHKFSIPMKVSPSQYPDYGDNAPEVAMSAFGQASTTATALQMAMVSAGIANEGVVMVPNLVEAVLTPSLTTVPNTKFSQKEFGRAVSADVAKQVTQMMVDGVNHGVASNARIDGVSVAGKTGTAQHGADDPYTLWFTGFAPADDPEYAVAVVVENGGGLGQNGVGNTVAAPIAKKVLEAVLKK